MILVVTASSILPHLISEIAVIFRATAERAKCTCINKKYSQNMTTPNGTDHDNIM